MEIYQKIIGEGKPLLILHGFPLNHENMIRTFEDGFKYSDYQRIYLDLPGMGKSTKLNVKSSNDILNNLLEFIERNYADTSLSIIGYSYGAYLAQGLLYKLQKKIVNLLLICPVIVSRPKMRILPELKPIIRDEELILKIQEKYGKEGVESVNTLMLQNTTNWEKFLNLYFLPMKDSENKARQLIWNDYTLDIEAEMLKSNYCSNATFILGKFDNIVGYKQALDISKNYKHATVHVLEKSGHVPQVDQSDEFLTLVKNWSRQNIRDYV